MESQDSMSIRNASGKRAIKLPEVASPNCEPVLDCFSEYVRLEKTIIVEADDIKVKAFCKFVVEITELCQEAASDCGAYDSFLDGANATLKVLESLLRIEVDAVLYGMRGTVIVYKVLK